MPALEDWDFRNCTPNSPGYDPEADLFLSQHYREVVAVERLRLNILTGILANGGARFTDDEEHVTLEPLGEGILRGMLTWRDVFTSNGRFYRSVVKALQRESQKYGRLRLTILPSQGAKGT